MREERFVEGPQGRLWVSTSGDVAPGASFAVEHPHRVAGLLLVDPPHDPATFPPEVVEQTLTAMRGPEYRDVAEGYYRSVAGTNPAVVERVAAEARSTAQATLVGVFEAERDFEPRRLAGRYAGPMLSVVQPQYDVDGALHRTPPGWPSVTIAGTGHWIHLDAPGPFLDVAKEFLARLR